jgi:hypothetical protein
MQGMVCCVYSPNARNIRGFFMHTDAERKYAAKAARARRTDTYLHTPYKLLRRDQQKGD